MKRKLLACTALVLCLALLCGCTSIATSEWMQDLFPIGDEAVLVRLLADPTTWPPVGLPSLSPEP